MDHVDSNAVRRDLRFMLEGLRAEIAMNFKRHADYMMQLEQRLNELEAQMRPRADLTGGPDESVTRTGVGTGKAEGATQASGQEGLGDRQGEPGAA